MPADPSHLVWIDLEMTGLDPDHCHILEIATIVTNGELDIIAEGPNLVLHMDPEIESTLSDWCRDHFGKSGLLERCRASTVSAKDAEDATMAFLKDHIVEGVSPLCGNSVHNDRAFLVRHMPRLNDQLHYRNVDVSTLKELVKRWYPKGPPPPPKKDVHEALSDIRESVEELRFYRQQYWKSL